MENSQFGDFVQDMLAETFDIYVPVFDLSSRSTRRPIRRSPGITISSNRGPRIIDDSMNDPTDSPLNNVQSRDLVPREQSTERSIVKSSRSNGRSIVRADDSLMDDVSKIITTVVVMIFLAVGFSALMKRSGNDPSKLMYGLFMAVAVVKTILPLIWSDNVSNLQIDNLADMATNLSIRPPTMKEVINMALKPGYQRGDEESSNVSNTSRITYGASPDRRNLNNSVVKTIESNDISSGIEEIVRVESAQDIENITKQGSSSGQFSESTRPSSTGSFRGVKNTRKSITTSSISERINTNYQQRQKLLQH